MKTVPMPPKAGKKTASSVPVKESCCICCQTIQPDKDKVLFCSGSCQQWLHCYCASASADCYKAAKSSKTPFFCFCCYRVCKEEQLSSLLNTIQALMSEISEIKKFVSTVPNPAAQPSPSYASAVVGGESHIPSNHVSKPQPSNTNPSNLSLSQNHYKKIDSVWSG